MSRTTKDIATSKPAAEVQRTVSEYLTGEGFALMVENGEEVWKKGGAMMIGPQFVKAIAQDGALRIEAWVQYGLLPGMGVGEMGLDGAFNVVPKRLLKRRVAELERLLS